jgi:hypothetical protein
MLILLASGALCIVLIIAAPIQIIIRQPKKQKGELIRMSETVVTAVMGGMLIALGFFILYMKNANSTIAGTDQNSYLFVGVFAVVSVAFGCGIMFYTFLQKIIACEDRVVFVTILGQYKVLYWDEIREIKVRFMSNKVTLIGKSTQFIVGGEPKTYKEFLKIAKKKIRPEVGSDVLEKLLSRS